MKKKLIFFLVPLILSGSSVESKKLILMMDSRNWAPFTFKEDNEIKGMHIDLVKEALDIKGYDYEIKAFPRKRAILNVERGKADAMISVGFSHQFKLFYPEDAHQSKESRYSIMQVDHVLVTPPVEFDFEGDLKKVPHPLRVPRGESLAEVFNKMGINVDIASTDEQNFLKMERDKNGCVVTTTIIAEEYFRKNKNIKIHSVPVLSRPYFLAFSTKSSITNMEIMEIWNEMEKLKKDYIFMLKLYSRY